MQEINALRVTYEWAEVGDLEKLCRPDSNKLLEKLVGSDGVNEGYVLQTCNRAEFYATGEHAREALKELEDEFSVRDGLARYSGHSESVRHLLRLACGLESMIIGEDEILGQVRDAYHEAVDAGALGDDGTLDKVVLKALHVAEKARMETRINEGNPSMGSAAVRLAEDKIDIDECTVVVIGAGDMGEAVAKSFSARGNVELLVTNRTFGRADHLSGDIGGTPVKFSELSDTLDRADVVVTATSAPHLIFDESDLEGYELLVLDLANPRDVDSSVSELDGVTLLDIDDVSSVSSSSVEVRREAAEEVEEIIDEELGVLENQFKRERAMEMLSTIYERAEDIRERETREALQKLDNVSSEDEDVIHDLTRSLVNKLLSTPTEALKNAAESEDYETLRSASDIFRLSEEDTTEEAEEAGAD